MASNSFAIDYNTHILLGHLHGGGVVMITWWTHTPTQAEVQQQIDITAEKTYDQFVLVTPCGTVLPGNYEPPEIDYSGGIC